MTTPIIGYPNGSDREESMRRSTLHKRKSPWRDLPLYIVGGLAALIWVGGIAFAIGRKIVIIIWG